MPSPLQLFTGSVPANYDQYLGPYLFEPYALDMVSRIKNDHCKHVLEVACGTGRVTRHLVNILPPEGQLIASDLNADMLAIASSLVQDKRILWQTTDAQSLPFADNTFDHVVCQFGVMFFPDKHVAFSEARRVLQPGGKFIFNTWASIEHNTIPAFIQNIIEDLFKENAPDFLKKGPYSFYDKQEIKSLMNETGFKNIQIHDVPKEVTYKNKEDLVRGLIDGSPLSAFIDSQPEGTREAIKQEARKRLDSDPGLLKASMLAFVCEGIK